MKRCVILTNLGFEAKIFLFFPPFAASDLKITRKVGTDGLVIAWLPSPDPECVGYLVLYY